MAARVASLADVFDSLIHDKPYCKAWPLKDAVDWIVEQKGRKFDPDVVDAFLRSDPQSPLPGFDEVSDLGETAGDYEAIFPEGIAFDGS